MSEEKKAGRKPGMTDKRKRFCEEYMIDLNGKAAAIRAGYSARSAAEIASELLNDVPEVREYLDQLMAERSKRTGYNAERVLDELAKIAFVNPADVVDLKTAKVKPNASREDLAAISSIKRKTVSGKMQSEENEVRFQDKNQALGMFLKHLGVDNKKISVQAGADGFKIVFDYGDDEEA